MDILSKLFPKWVAPKRQVEVALGLIEYIQKLHAGAILQSGLTDEMVEKYQKGVEKYQKGEAITDLQHTDIGLTPHAQLFMFNLISHACQEAGLDEKHVARVIVRVMCETLHVEPGEVNGAMLGYLKWFTDVASEINVAEKAGDPVPDEMDHRVFLESCAAAKRFARATGTDAADPADGEIEFFTSLCEAAPAEA
jgi:hypothetical protein